MPQTQLPPSPSSFICTAIAWGILGGTIFSRTYSPRSGKPLWHRRQQLGHVPKRKVPPSARLLHGTKQNRHPRPKTAKTISRPSHRTSRSTRSRSKRSRIDVTLQPRLPPEKACSGFSTYARKFLLASTTTVNPSGPAPKTVTFTLDFPAAQAIYDDPQPSSSTAKPATLTTGAGRAYDDRQRPRRTTYLGNLRLPLPGLDNWNYKFGEGSDNGVSPGPKISFSNMHHQLQSHRLPPKTRSRPQKSTSPIPAGTWTWSL